MKTGRFIKWTLASLALLMVCSLASCGPVHSYWGLESDYYSDSPGRYPNYYPNHRRPSKPPKPPKPPKHKHKHHKHHHHDD